MKQRRSMLWLFTAAFALVFGGLGIVPQARAQVRALNWYPDALVLNATDTSGFTSVEVTVNNAWDGTFLDGQRATRDIIYSDPVDVAYRDTTWIGTAATPGSPVPMAIAGMDSLIDPVTRLFQASRLTFQGVDFHTQNVKMQFFGTTSSLNLDNAAIRFGDAQPGAATLAAAPITFNAAASTANTISTLSHQIGAAATVNVPNAATLTFANCGSVETGQDPTTRLWFEQPDNTFAINGGTLSLQNSYLIATVTDIFADKLGDFRVSNGGTLSLAGQNTTLQTNYLTIDSSTLSLGSNTYLKGHNASFLDRPVTNLDLVSATVDVFAGGQFITGALTASGSNEIHVQGGDNLNHASFDSLLMADASTSVSIQGTAAARVHVGTEGTAFPLPTWSFNGGTLTIQEGAADATFSLIVGQERKVNVVPEQVVVDPFDANIVVDGVNTSLIIGENATFIKKPDTTLTYCTMALINGGKLSVEPLGTFVGSGTISGSVGDSLVFVDSGSVLEVDDQRAPSLAHDLHVQTDISMTDSATLKLGVLPSITAADTLTVDGELALGSTAQLNLYVEAANDATLPLGTSLLLIDYSDTYGYQGKFSNRLDNSIFTLGLNTYQIKYSDPTWAGGTNASVMTLTVVPEPSSLALLAVGAVGSVAVMHRRRRKASSLAAA